MSPPLVFECTVASDEGYDAEEGAYDHKGDCGLGEEGGVAKSIVHNLILRREKTRHVHYSVLGILNEGADSQQQRTTYL